MMPFEKGTSGNLKGRTGGKTPGAKLRAAIELRADDILQSVINSAVDGDMTACKMLLDRITPTLKPQAMAINLPVKNSLPEQGNEIIRATVSGKMAPDVASQLIMALANQGKLVDLQEMAERLQRIEKQLESRK
jgi:hypothetical protein